MDLTQINGISTSSTQAIILFDGNCMMCNRSVKFILRKEKQSELFFAALQSDFGKTILKQFGLEGKSDSIVLIENKKAHTKSGAALRICKYLKRGWPLMMGFIIVPPFIRNAVYDYISKNRIKWYGNSDYCEMITPELKKRFLE